MIFTPRNIPTRQSTCRGLLYVRDTMLKILGCYALTAMQENNNEENRLFLNFITLERDCC